MSITEAVLIAIVEGITEFLPVSSTGHMIIAQKLLGVESTDFVKAFTVNIQFGAILSVVVLYWQRFFRLNPLAGMEKESFMHRIQWRFDFYIKLLIAFLPAPILVLLVGDTIDRMLENVTVVSAMLLAGGLVMLFADRWLHHPAKDQVITHKKAWIIGCYQCLAMVPGVSRSMATILGGMAQKLSRQNAAEFSFFLAVPTMFAASVYKLYETKEIIMDPGNLLLLLIGNLVSFLVALLAIRWFIGVITRHGFRVFGWYRIVVGLLLLGLILSGTELSIV